METAIRFIIDIGNDKIEEYDTDTNEIIKTISADTGTILAYLDIARKHNINKIKTISQLEELANNY